MREFKDFFEEIPSWMKERLENNYWQAKKCQELWGRSLSFRAEVCGAKEEQTKNRILKTLDKY